MTACFVCGCLSSPTLSKKDSPNPPSGGTLSSSSKEGKSGPGGNRLFVGKILFSIPEKLIFADSSNIGVANSPGNTGVPEVVFCERCDKQVEEARRIYRDLLEALRNFRIVQKELVDTLKRNREKGFPVQEKIGEGSNSGGIVCFENWKQFIVNYDYGQDTDPFLVDNLRQLGEYVSESWEPSASLSAPDDDPLCKSEIDISEEIEEEGAGLWEFPPKNNINNETENEDGTGTLGEIKEEVFSSAGEESSPEEEEEEAEWQPEASMTSSGDEDDEEDNPLKVSATTDGISESGDDSDEDFVPQKKKRERPRKTASSTTGVGGNDKPGKKLKNCKRKERVPQPCTVEGCSASFLTKAALSRHITLHPAKPTHHCKHCNAAFFAKKYILPHIATAHPELVCDICGVACLNDMGLSVHLKVNHQITRLRPPKTHRCPEESCDRVFAKKDTLKVHLSKHRGEPLYRCALCEESFFDQRQLRRHNDSVHVDEGSGRAFICELCGKSFRTGEYLSNHLHVKHDQGKMKGKKRRMPTSVVYRGGRKAKGIKEPDQGPHTCPHCGRDFLRKASLSQHVRFHERGFSYFCEVCGKGCNSKVALNIHLFRVHQVGSGEEYRKWVRKAADAKARCAVVGCRVYFWGDQAEENLRQHTIRVHGEDGQGKQFQCPVCGLGFSLPYKFKQHLLIHENKDTRPFKCDTCGKGFVNRGNLRYHQLHTHKAEKLTKRKPRTKQTVKGEEPG